MSKSILFAAWMLLALPAFAQSFGGGQAQPGPSLASQREQTEKLWQLLRAGGYVLVMRHGRTEPRPDDADEGVTIGDCSTQRMLSKAGRDDLAVLNSAFISRRIPLDRVVSSEFCRALESARIVVAGATDRPIQIWDKLNFHPKVKDRTLAPRLAELGAEVRLFLSGFSGPGNLLIVTHTPMANFLLFETPGFALVEGEFAILRSVAPGVLEYHGRLPRSAW